LCPIDLRFSQRLYDASPFRHPHKFPNRHFLAARGRGRQAHGPTTRVHAAAGAAGSASAAKAASAASSAAWTASGMPTPSSAIPARINRG
jgi:hypothetical protein